MEPSTILFNKLLILSLSSLLLFALGVYTIFLFCRSKLRGSGGFGSVFESPRGTLYKHMHYDDAPTQKQVATKQTILNNIDPHRQVFGGKITRRLNPNSNKALRRFPMKDDGMSLQNFFKQSKHVDLKKLLQSFLSLLKGFEKLNSEGYMHGDVKLENIVINKDDYKIKMIDYDLLNMVPFEYNRKYIHPRKFYADVWPPEVVLDKWIPWEKFIDQEQHLQMLLLYFKQGTFYQDYEKEYRSLQQNSDSIEKVKNDAKLFFERFDVYGLGWVAFQVFYPLYKEYDDFRSIIHGMTNPNITKRLTIQQATEEWSKFIENNPSV